MKGLIEEIKKLGNIILVIDEVHNLVGAGDAEGSMNAANILKPALSRGELQVIGATTLVEYRKYIEKDSALERRFQPVIVNEPSIEDAVEIIKGVAPYYESFHHVKITPRHCPPGRAHVGALYHRPVPARQGHRPHRRSLFRRQPPGQEPGPQSMEVEKELNDIAVEREVMVADASDKAYERLAELRSKELQLLQEQKRTGAAGGSHSNPGQPGPGGGTLDQDPRQHHPGAGVRAPGQAGRPAEGARGGPG